MNGAHEDSCISRDAPPGLNPLARHRAPVSLPAVMKAILTWPALILVLVVAPSLDAGQREVVSGFVEPVIRPGYQYLLRPERDREARMGLVDGVGDDSFRLPARARLDVERRDNFTGGLPLATALRRLPDEVFWPGTFHLSPERFAGQNTGLNPGFHESDPFAVMDPPDFDSDGVPDEGDVFPDDPAESADNDRDGRGDNGDPDDDNDGMPDDYEQQNLLDPLADDSQDDADGDGMTNAGECAARTNAQDAGSFFVFERISAVPGVVRLVWQGLPGRHYEVWHRPGLIAPGQRLHGGIAVPEPATLRVDLPSAVASDFYFLRVVLHPPL